MLEMLAALVVSRATLGMTNAEACNFVASRLLKETNSLCLRQRCVNHSVLMLEGVELTCERAHGIATDIVSTASEYATPLQPPALVALIETVIYPALVNLLIFSQVPPYQAISAMSSVDSSLLWAAQRWPEFRQQYQVELRKSEIIPKIAQKLNTLFETMSYVSQSLDIWAASVGPFAHFFFDLNSFFPEVGSSSGGPPFAARAAFAGRLLYRHPYRLEVQEALSPGPATTTAWFVELSSSISKIRDMLRFQAPVIDSTILSPLGTFLTRWQADSSVDHSSALRLIHHQISIDLCRNSTIGKLVSHLMAADARRPPLHPPQGRLAAMALLSHCRWTSVAVPPDRLVELSVLLYRSMNARISSDTTPLRIPDPSDNDAVALFLNRSRGVTILVCELEFAQTLLLNAAAGQLTSGGPPWSGGQLRSRASMGIHFEAAMETFGRLLAIVLRCGGSAAGLQFPIQLVLWLGHEGLASSMSAEPLFYIKKGARDILGFLGFRVFSTDTLLSRFGY